MLIIVYNKRNLTIVAKNSFLQIIVEQECLYVFY